MKKTVLFLFAVVCIIMLFGVSGQVMATSSIIVAPDVPPRMMNPHGDDSDAGLQYFANFFDGLLQRKGSEGTLAPALAERLGATGCIKLEVLVAQRGEVSQREFLRCRGREIYIRTS